MTHLVDKVLRNLPADRARMAESCRFIIRSGGGGPGETDQAIVWGGDARPIAVAKMARGPIARRALRTEWDRLGRLAALADGELRSSLPRPLGFEDDGARAILVQDHLAGRRMKDLNPQALSPTVLDRVVDWLITFTRAVGVRTVQPNASALHGCLDEMIDRYRATFEVDSAEEQLLRELGERVRDSFGPSIPLVGAHGDFADANILLDGDRIGVVDWEEPTDWTLPGGDLFYFLCSLQATKHGLGDRQGFQRGFEEAFFRITRTSTWFRNAWSRYRSALGLTPQSTLPLFAAAWVGFAVAKARYLERCTEPGTLPERLFEDRQQDYPVVFCADGRCLNVLLTARNAKRFAL